MPKRPEVSPWGTPVTANYRDVMAGSYPAARPDLARKVTSTVSPWGPVIWSGCAAVNVRMTQCHMTYNGQIYNEEGRRQ